MAFNDVRFPVKLPIPVLTLPLFALPVIFALPVMFALPVIFAFAAVRVVVMVAYPTTFIPVPVTVTVVLPADTTVTLPLTEAILTLLVPLTILGPGMAITLDNR